MPATAVDGELSSFSAIAGGKPFTACVETLTQSDGSKPITINVHFNSSDRRYIFHKKDEVVNSNFTGRIHKAVLLMENGKLIEEGNINPKALSIIANGLTAIENYNDDIDAPKEESSESLIKHVANTYYI